jgi:ABC-type transport system involved in multi-copper enzyme maturation permease subunit
VNRLEAWRFRWHLARTIQRRDLRATIYGIGPYATLSAAIALAAAVLRNHVKSVQDSGLVVLSSPFVTPLFGAAVLSSVYLAVASMRTICRERNQGMLEVLFYGPMDAIAYLLGKYLTQISVYSLMVAGYLVAFALYALITNFCFDLNLLLATLLSVATTSAVVTLGILLSTLNRSARSALFTLLATVLAFLGVQLGNDYVSSLASELARGHHNLPLSLQTAFTWLNLTVNWLSPFAHLERGIDALLRGSIAEYWLMMGLSLLYTAIAFGLAVRTMRRKGVR